MSEKINGLWYGTILQWKMDLRSRSMLVACYLVPLLFFALMGGIFTSVMPQMKETLIPSMIVMGVSMGAFIGLPPSLAELYGSDIRKVYRANGVPLWLGLATAFLSAFVHLMLMCTIILLIAPAAFDAALPANLPIFYGALAIYAGTGGKKSGKADYGGADSLSALHHAVGDHVSRRYAAGGAADGRENVPRRLGISADARRRI